MTSSKKAVAITKDQIDSMIQSIRGLRVMLDADLARIYAVSTSRFNEAVKRNRKRFPADFMFQLTKEEAGSLRFQFGTSDLRSQIAISKPGRGGRRYLPYVFTEQGVAMLSSVLRSPRAIAANVEIMRAFVQLRKIVGSNAEFARKLDALEQKYAAQFVQIAVNTSEPVTWMDSVSDDEYMGRR